MSFFDADGNPVELGADNPAIKALLDSAVSEATSGLAANKDEILAEKKALQEKLEGMSNTWKGLDPEAVRNIMNRMENDEETKLLAEGKMDEVIARRTERLKADHTKQVETLQQKIDALSGDLNGATGQVKTLKVEGGLRQAAVELGLVPSAIPDALARAMDVFKLQDDGALVPEQDGATLYGKDGKPMSQGEWLETMKEQAPHWFPAPTGGGAGGGSNRGGSHTISRSDARDVTKYRSAKEAAEKSGVTLEIVG